MEGRGSLTDEYGGKKKRKKEIYKIYGVANSQSWRYNQYSVSFVWILHTKLVLTVPDVCRGKNRGKEKIDLISGTRFLNGSYNIYF